MLTPKLYLHLPEYISTPDSMEIDRDGNLVLSCPNFADPSMSGCVVKIGPDRHVTKWFDVPVHPETGVARNMGISLEYTDSGLCNVYLCDNQGWSGDESLAFKGRMLKITMDGDKMVSWCTMADGMEHPNGVRVRDGFVYVTQSMLSKVKYPSGRLISCVYRFSTGDRDIVVNNTLDDPDILCTFITHNPDCQYGADGIAFDRGGNLYVGNFGDGTVYRIAFNPNGTVRENRVWAADPGQLQSTDGMIFDAQGFLYVADFSANAVARISPDGKTVERLAQSGDKSGFAGGLEQPGEVIVYRGMVVASCFDLVTGPDKINTGHEMPATLSCLEINLPLE